MKTLIFTPTADGRYVSEAISASEVTLHITFPEPASLIVERTADESHGWATVASRNQFSGLYEESVVGIPEGVQVRVNASAMPTVAQALIVE